MFVANASTNVAFARDRLLNDSKRVFVLMMVPTFGMVDKLGHGHAAQHAALARPCQGLAKRTCFCFVPFFCFLRIK